MKVMSPEKSESIPSKNQENVPAAGKPETVELARAEYEELLRKTSELIVLQDRLLRSAADFDNAKKRLVKEREEMVKFALEDAIRDLLPTLDHFELALAHLDVRDEKLKSIRDGFLLIQKQFMAVLTGRGVKRLDALGKAFDPHRHEAVGFVVSESGPEGVIAEEILSGYELNGKLLRPAKVKVSSKQAPLDSEKEEELT
jgi:molecular chaperone GrpE